MFVRFRLRPGLRLPRYLPWVIGAFVAAAGLRLFVLPVTRSPFDSDEAILLLMARHILRGERPVFFYGEAYGGSADSYLIAFFYSWLGDTVSVGRLVQSLEYLVGMGFTYMLARRLLPGARLGPLAALWLMAMPPLLMTTWTTPAVLYAIVICLNSILLYLGHRLLWEDAERPLRWAVFGAVAGLAFWTFGILVVTLLPLFIFIVCRWRWHRSRRDTAVWPGYLLATATFFVCSWPWWTHMVAGLQVAYAPQSIGTAPSLFERIVGFLGLTLPAFFGFRDPWLPQVTWPALAVPVLIFYLAAILYAIVPLLRTSASSLRAGRPRGIAPTPVRRAGQSAPTVEPLGLALLGAQAVVWAALYFGTRFSADPTGRYILPLYSSLFLVAGLLLERIYRWRVLPAVALLVALLTFNLATHIRAVQSVPPGITAQMNPALQFGNASDQALIDFVAAHGGRGYSHHWISYKIAFLSDERVILAAYLPSRSDLRWNPMDDRYPPYAQAVAASHERVYVTHREPYLEAYLQRAFAGRQITYRVQDIGPYRVYYDLSAVVTPQQIGLGLP
jgi:hypothetical protein